MTGTNLKRKVKSLPVSVHIISIVVILLIGALLGTSVLRVNAATVASGNGTWISGKLTYTWEATSNGTTSNGATGSVSVSNSKLTVSATNSKEVSGCSTTAPEATTTTVTVTNVSSYPIKINTLTTTGSASVSGVSQGDTIASGATFKVTVTAPAVSSSTAVTGTVTIAVEEQTNVTITLKPSPYVGYTVNGTTVAQNGSDQTFEANVNSTVSLPSITAPSGYEFKGWRVGSNLITGNSFTAAADYNLFPVIVAEGTDTTAANFKVGSNTYTFWEDAVTAAVSGGGVVLVNLTEVSLPDNVLDNMLPASGGTYVKPVSGGGVEYIIPAGVTLHVPKDTTATLKTTTPEYEYATHVNPTPFRTLTVPNGAKITVNGSVAVASKVCAQGQNDKSWNGTPSGPHGKIVMKTGSTMNFNSGANLYCYGYINGDGMITMNSGAKVYELFQFRDWRGGTATNTLKGNSNRVFPMNQYYVQNVEAPMKLYKGATEYVWSVVNMSSDAYPTKQIEFIGSSGMFKLTGNNSDYIIKRYHANVDRLEITAHGDMSLNNLTVTISGLPLIGTISMNSSSYVLPINNMEIVVESGTSSIASGQTYGVAFLPSSKLTVMSGATFSVNAPVYFYDNDDWGNYACAGGKLVVVGYSTANGTTAVRTASNLKDAELDVNGTVTVSNKLYTTAGGAHITSSEGTGVINFTSACATSTATTYQATQSGSDISYVGITCNNAWLQNGDDSYNYTVGTGTSTWYYDKPGEHWYRYTVDFVYNGNTIYRDYYCENNDTITYDASWLTSLGASVTSGTATVGISGSNVNVTSVTANATVTLTGTPPSYIPTFVLNEHQYGIYQGYTGGTLSETITIGDDTYYIVDQASSALAVGTTYTAPTDASMGVTAENYNDIIWNLSGVDAYSGNPYLGAVPVGGTDGDPVYVYGFYTGYVAYNSFTNERYTNLLDAINDVPQSGTVTVSMLADCGSFETESSSTKYSTYPDINLTLDLNGHKAVGTIENTGNLTVEFDGGTLTGAITNKAGGTITTDLDGGTLTGNITNSGTFTHNVNGGANSGTITNNASCTFDLTLGGGTQTGAITNSGTFNCDLGGGDHLSGTITNNAGGTFDLDMDGGTVTGAVTNNGAFTADFGSSSGTLTGNVTNNAAAATAVIDMAGGTLTGNITNKGTFTQNVNSGTQTGTITNNASCTYNLDLNGGTVQYVTTATAASSSYRGKAAIINNGTLTISDTAGGGKVTGDAISDNSSATNYSAVVRNNSGATLTMTGGTLQNKPASVNNYSSALLNYGTANISHSTLTANRGITLFNLGTASNLTLTDSTVSVTNKSGSYAVYNTSTGTITEISRCELSTINTPALYNYNNSKITTLEETSMTVTTPTTANIYAVWNYGGAITTMSGCTITGNSGINNRNQRTSAGITAGYELAYQGTIGTIDNTTVTVGQYALYNGGTITNINDSSFYAQPASAQVPWGSGTVALNGNKVHCYTVVNSNLWWYDSAVQKRTDTTVDNNGTSMLQRRVSTYTTDDAHMPTIGSITGHTVIEARNTSTSNSYGYYALQNQGVINSIGGTTEITAKKHDSNAKSVYGYYALYNTGGGKIGSIGSGVKINAYNYAVTNLGARYASTDVTYSTTYLESGALKSGGLATDYDYTYADVSTIGSTAATISSTSQYAILNYSKIVSVTGTISGNYNVIVNAGAAGTTTGIEGSTANTRAIEHRYFTDNDSSTTANEYRRYFEYTRNTTDGCYIGSINATITATGAGYQAVTNQGYIGTIAGTVTTPTGKATSSSTYYPLIYNGNSRQATLKQTEDYYTETNGAGATKYLREYTYEIPTIGTISCTATNPQDYTLQNYGQINNLTGSISGKTITVANEAGGPFLTRKTITFYSSSSARFAADKASTEVPYEYTKQPAEITNITGATIKTTDGTVALRNYGKLSTITGSEITSSSTGTITNGSSTVTEYTSNRLDVLTGCVPNGTSSCALAYDTTQTINENEVRVISEIDTIGDGNYVQGTGTAITNSGRINTINSGTGNTTIIYTSGNAANVYNYDGQYTRRTNTAAELTNTTGSLTNHYSYDYVPAYIGTIKNVYILGKRNAILNGASTANVNYNPVTIREIGEGVEVRNTAASYDVVLNNANAKIETISGGVFTCYSGSNYALNNSGATYPINITGGDFRGGDGTRALAIKDADNTSKYTYSTGNTGKKLSTVTETATYHTKDGTTLTAATNSYYFITDIFSVTFDENGHGTAPASQTVESGLKATEPTAPTATGYRFDGWYKEAACTNVWDFTTDTVTATTTLYAKWTALYTVDFNVQGHGTAPASQTVESGMKATAPSGFTSGTTTVTESGVTYRFDGWYKESGCSNAWDFDSDTVTENTTLYAKWTALYTVDFNVQGHGTAPASITNVVSGSKITAPTAPTADGFRFDGWYKEAGCSNAWNFSTDTVTANTTIYAKWTALYTVDFDVQDHGTAPASITNVVSGSKITAPTAPTADGFRFDGWYKEAGCSNAWDFSTDTVTANTTLYAKWTATTRTITFINYDGTVLQTGSVNVGETPAYTGDIPTKPSSVSTVYSFSGWSDGTDTYDKDESLPNVTGDMTYTATFSESTREYEITWVLGNRTETTYVDYGSDLTQTASTYAVGYVSGIYTFAFESWDTTPSTNVTENAIYTAQYSLSDVDEYHFFTQHSLSLNGCVGVNFYITLPEGGLDPADYTYDINFYKEDECITGAHLSADNATVNTNEYKISFPVDAPEMTDTVEAVLYFKGVEVERNSYKTVDYADSVVPGNTDTTLEDGAFYLVGTIMGKDCWNENINLQYKMTQNPNNSSEYMLQHVELQAGDRIKVIQYHANSPLGWFPDGTGNEYVVGTYYGTEGCSTGTFTVYVNPTNDYNTVTNWDGRSDKKIYVAPETSSADLLPSLIRAMHNYGSKAQVNFKHNTNDLADSTAYIKSPNSFAEVTNDMINARLGTEGPRDTSLDSYKNAFSDYGITYAGHSLVMNSNTRMRFYFTFSDGFDLDNFNATTNFTIDGETVKAVWGNKGKTMIYFEVSGIEAANLDEEYVLSDGTNSIGYSALDYVRLTLNQGDALKNLGQALYWYNYYADLYFGAVATEQQQG